MMRLFRALTGLLAVLLVTASAVALSPTAKIPYHSFAYNDWLCDFMVNPAPMGPQYLDMLASETARGGADVLMLNPNGQTANYPSKVWQPLWKAYAAGDVVNALGATGSGAMGQPAQCIEFLDQTMQLVNQNIDYLAYTYAAARREGIATGASLRMNDVHGGASERNLLVSDFQVHNPQLLVPGTAYFNYAQPEVRDHFMQLAGEMIGDYDIDVLDLDFMRNPTLFPGSVSTEQRCSIMTTFMRDIHQRIQNSSKTIALTVRVPSSSVSLAKSYGLDVQQWAQEGLIDGVELGGYLHSTWGAAVPEFRQAVGNNVAIYPSGDYFADSREGLPAREMGLNADLMRGFAAGQLANGADGTYWFNFVVVREATQAGMWGDRPPSRDTSRPEFEAIGQSNTLEGLRGTPKTYIVSNITQHGPNSGDSLSQLPIDLNPGEQHSFDMLLAREPDWAKVDVAVVFRGAASLDDLWLANFNGTALNTQGVLEAGPGDAQTLLFPILPSEMLDGHNWITIQNGDTPIRVVAFEVRVVPEPSPFVLLSCGLLSLLAYTWRKHKTTTPLSLWERGRG